MLYRPSSFKKSSRAVTAVAAVGLFVTASFMATNAASAGEPNQFAAACAAIKDPNKHAGCMIDAIDKDTQRLKQQGAAADVRAAASQSVIDCVQFLTTGVKSGSFVKSEILQKADGKLSDTNACPVARQFGYGRKAEAMPSARLN